MANSLAYKRTHFTHFKALPRRMKYETIAEREAAKKREAEARLASEETDEQKRDDPESTQKDGGG